MEEKSMGGDTLKRELILLFALSLIFFIPEPIAAPSAGAINEQIVSFWFTLDATVPTISNGGAPSSPVRQSTATISINTNENATCRMSATSGVTYDSMTITMNTTDNLFHSSILNQLSNGKKTYYFRCRDPAGNTNPSDYSQSFRVVIDGGGGQAGGGGGVPPTAIPLVAINDTNNTIEVIPETSEVNIGEPITKNIRSKLTDIKESIVDTGKQVKKYVVAEENNKNVLGVAIFVLVLVLLVVFIVKLSPDKKEHE